MLFALHCAVALVNFVCRLCVGTGCDSPMIQICHKKGFRFIDELTHCSRSLENGVCISFMGAHCMYIVYGGAFTTGPFAVWVR